MAEVGQQHGRNEMTSQSPVMGGASADASSILATQQQPLQSQSQSQPQIEQQQRKPPVETIEDKGGKQAQENSVNNSAMQPPLPSATSASTTASSAPTTAPATAPAAPGLVPEDMLEKKRKLLERLKEIDAEKQRLRAAKEKTPGDDGSRGSQITEEAPVPAAVVLPPSEPVQEKEQAATDVLHVEAARPAPAAVSTSAPIAAGEVPDVDAEPAKPAHKRKRSSSAALDERQPSLNDDENGDEAGRPKRERRSRLPSIHAKPFPGEPSTTPNKIKLPYAHTKRFSFCTRLVKEFLKIKEVLPFRAPVNEMWPAEAIPGYFDLVARPMDFRTITEQLANGTYTRPGTGAFDTERFAFDFRQVFKNAMLYNRPEDKLFQDAAMLLHKFEARFSELPVDDPMPPPGGAVSSGGVVSGGALSVHSGGSIEHKPSRGRPPATAAASPGPSKKKPVLDRRASTGNIGIPVNPRSKKLADPDFGATAGASSAGKKPSGTGRGRGRPKGSGVAPAESAGGAAAATNEFEHLNLNDALKKLSILKRQRMTMAADYPLSSATLKQSALYHLAMTYDEKKRLSDNVSKLKEPQIVKLLEIIKKHTNSQFTNSDGEVELDVDALDTNTLREMEAFVNSCVHRRKLGAKDGSGVAPEVLDKQIQKLEQVVDKLKMKSVSSQSNIFGAVDSGVDPYASSGSSDSDDGSSGDDSSEDDE
mmetsp:Transcript_1861/g.3250  ORF Transcript_1861/g.3250 Transcript_1861/m.3250 type:complete len:704 (-) Transcript_1861:114-2225(-)